MRLHVSCLSCVADGREPDQPARVELEDSGLYRLTCNHGHETVSILQNLELLG